ncbi:hypothetical protein Pelo_17716 [Pelomyxa schiedti]|nr:hypothetical protein Pelo_17716 [Pelomyxa schiedti]
MLRKKVVEHLKTSFSPLQFMFKGLGIDAVKWLLSVLQIRREDIPWALYLPVLNDLNGGLMEPFEWIFDEFNLGKRLPDFALREMVNWCAFGHSPSNIKWCIDKFLRVPVDLSELLFGMVANNHATVEAFQQVEAYITGDAVSIHLLPIATNEDTVKWVLSKLQQAPNEGILNSVCQHIGDVSFVEWLITERHFTPTLATFASACSTPKRNGASLAKWLSTRLTITLPVVINSLKKALIYNNTDVADWLEATFHVMDAVNSSTVEDAGSVLVDICQEYGDFEDKCLGLRWFLQHISQPANISDTAIHRAIEEELLHHRGEAPMVLLSHFPAFDPQRDPNLFAGIFTSVMGRMKLREQFLTTFGSSPLLTPEFVANCLTPKNLAALSSKTVKWAISRFNLQYSHIKLNNNSLLLKLLCIRKNRCVQWLLDSFDIPLNDIFEMTKALLNPTMEQVGQYVQIELSGWRILLNKYPTIDRAAIIEHLMPMVVQSPHTAEFTIREYGITPEQVRQWLEANQNDQDGGFGLLAAGCHPNTDMKIWISLLGPNSTP